MSFVLKGHILDFMQDRKKELEKIKKSFKKEIDDLKSQEQKAFKRFVECLLKNKKQR